MALIFWYMDFTRQAIQNLVIEINNNIELTLEDPTDENIMKLQSPVFSRRLGNKRKFDEYKRSAMFRKWRVWYYGSMLLGSIFLFFFL